MQLDDVEDFIEEAKHRLRMWGAEERRQLRIEMDGDGTPLINGWDSQTIAQTIMLHGGRAPTGTGTRIEEAKPEIVETDEIVTRLARLHKDGKYIIATLYCHYVFKTSIRQGARMTHKSARAYRDMLETGQAWVAGSLSTLVV